MTAGSLLLLLVLAACDHSTPFGSPGPGPQRPFATQPPVRLTFSAGDDRTPAWLPDQSGIIYSSQRLDRDDDDRCLHLLPPGGGQVQRQICEWRPAYDDTTDRYESPAVSVGGRIAYLRATSRIGLQKGPRMHLLSGALADAAAREVMPIPYFAPSGRTHYNVSHLQWLDENRLIFLGEDLFYQGSTFLPDTFATGLEIILADLSGDLVALSVVPGTGYASSVATDPAAGDANTIAFTLGGDSRVYQQSLTSGERTVMHDFGTAGIARDVQVRGRILVAIVGRSVLFQFEEAHGWVQRDEGGDLHVVDLETGDERVHRLAETLFRRPSLSPDARHIVVEASPFAPVHIGPVSDFNAANHRPDLWLFDLE